LKTPSKWLVKVVLLALEWYPLLDLFRLRPRPPLSFMAPDERLDFLRRRFHRAVVTRRLPRHLRKLVQAMIRFAKQLCYLGYYNDPRSYASVGYRPFSERRPGTPGSTARACRSMGPSRWRKTTWRPTSSSWARAPPRPPWPTSWPAPVDPS
jgi:hypothetical protein